MKQGLLEIRDFIIPTSLVRETIQFLRLVGTKGCEGFVLWGGRIIDPRTFRFERAIIPTQDASVTESGLLVTVGGESLFDVNRSLHESGAILGAQVHSHPTNAYHSLTDDQYPLATLVGALSVVIPNFARRAPQDMDEWAWYRLSSSAMWDPVDSDVTVTFE